MIYILAAVTPQGADWERARRVSPMALSGVQRRIYDFIRQYQQMWDSTPLYREIARGCGLRSSSAVGYQIARLVQLGVMRKPPRLVRAIRLEIVPVKLS